MNITEELSLRQDYILSPLGKLIIFYHVPTCDNSIIFSYIFFKKNGFQLEWKKKMKQL